MTDGIRSSHAMLSNGPDFESCSQQVLRFFERTLLVRYDRIEVVAQRSCTALEPEFHRRVEEGIAANRQEVARHILTLKEIGISTIDEVASIAPGYPSKIFHLIAHILDGFIGIDSSFFNLVDDSHWVSDKLWKRINDNPGQYWLIQVEASSENLKTTALIHT